jgi:glycosyltransferase involved in cell wall biosynthesis
VTDELAQRLDGIAQRLAALEHGQAQLLDLLAETRTRTRRTQALTARAYEALQGWPELLAAARADRGYERAYETARPLISIPIPTYHSPDTLCDRALASVLAQSYDNWEALVIGDHCTDDTRQRVEALRDPRITFHNLPVRETDPTDPWERWAVKGSVPRTTGIARARGLWIAPLSHDDAWAPDHLQTLLGAAQHHHSEVAYSRMRTIDAAAPDHPVTGTIGAWPPHYGQFGWQAAMFHGGLHFMGYDRACALASEPNDWNLARRAWEAGVRFHYVDRETVDLYLYNRGDEIAQALAALGLPPSAIAAP